jgi:hypothetical protein
LHLNRILCGVFDGEANMKGIPGRDSGRSVELRNEARLDLYPIPSLEVGDIAPVVGPNAEGHLASEEERR